MTPLTLDLPPLATRAHVIVFGNEKGGSGKSTAAMHVAIGLLRQGLTVATIDLDARQGTLSNYIGYRQDRANRAGVKLPIPTHRAVARSSDESRSTADRMERDGFADALSAVISTHDVVVVDTPGSDQLLTRLAHMVADTLVTPINDSFVDLSLLAVIDPDTLKIVKPSIYSQMVWEQRTLRASRRLPPVDWIVMRNRLGHIQARNKEDVAKVVEALQKRLNFRIAPGFGERVIFRELYLKGLTMLDLRESDDTPLSVSHVAARSEVRALMRSIGITRESLDQARAAAAAAQAAAGSAGAA